MTISCTKRLTFSAAHRLYRHEGLSNNVHGHNYAVLLTAEAEELDDVGRTVDFSVIASVVGEWLSCHLDRALIFNVADGELEKVSRMVEGQRAFRLDVNPTVEHLAAYLYGVANELLGPVVYVNKVTVFATDDKSATFELPRGELRCSE